MSLIKVRDLEKTYNDGTRALRGVSFDVKEGEFIAIMGPSGSGKSTLLHVLGFLDRQTKGSYHYKDKRFIEYDEEELARLRNEEVGFVFQMFNLLPRMSVLENTVVPLTYASVPKEEREERALSVIKSVGLEERTDYDVTRLSGGERQRAAIARALINNPGIIFADEPTGNLDSVAGKLVMDILERLHKEDGHTIILITHETQTAEYANRIIRLRDGLIESDSVVKTKTNGVTYSK